MTRPKTIRSILEDAISEAEVFCNELIEYIGKLEQKIEKLEAEARQLRDCGVC